MNESFFSGLIEALGNSTYVSFTSKFVPNQALPTENFLLNRFSYNSGTAINLNNVVRVAEVSDGLIFKLPLIQGVKIPYTQIRGHEVEESNGKVHLKLFFHDPKMGVIEMHFSSQHLSQIPVLLTEDGKRERLMAPPTLPQKSDSETKTDLWSIPIDTNNTPIPKNEPVDFGGWVRVMIMVGLLIFGLMAFTRFTLVL